jgi:hypothetical protein
MRVRALWPVFSPWRWARRPVSVVQIAAARRPGVKLSDRLRVMNNEVPLTAQEIAGSDRGRHGELNHLRNTTKGTTRGRT